LAKKDFRKIGEPNCGGGKTEGGLTQKHGYIFFKKCGSKDSREKDRASKAENQVAQKMTEGRDW